MRIALTKRRLTGIVLLLGAAILASGCGKWRTELSLKKAKSLKVKAQEYQAETYLPTQFKALGDIIVQAENAMNGQNYAESVPQAKEAVVKGKDLVDEARIKHSTTLKAQAEKDIAVCRDNDGRQQNAEIFTKIEGLMNQITDKYGTSKHDDVIRLAQEMRQLVNELLANLQRTANEEKMQVANRIEDMKRELVPQYAAKYMEEVGGYLKEIEKYIDPDRQYKKAIDKAKHAKMVAADGITETQRLRSDEKLRGVEAGLVEAKQLGAGVRFTIKLNEECNQAYSQLLERNTNKEYVFVLNSVGLLQEKINLLITQTKKEAARAAIDELQIELVKLVNGHARDYEELVKSVDQIQALYDKAEQQFSEGLYDEIRTKTCSEGLKIAEDTKANFSRLASDHIRKAENAYNEADSVFKTATKEGFFIIKAPGKLLDIDLPFEQSKEALFEKIKTSLASVADQLQVAQTRRGEEKYNNAIIISNAALKSAQENLNEVYHVGAHNAVVELSDRVTHFKQDGADQYATREIRQAEQEVVNVRKRIQDGEYRGALDQSAEARAQLENAVAALARKADEMIAEAKGSLDSATAEGVQQRRPDKMKYAEDLIKDASEKMGVAPPTPLQSTDIRYKRAIEQTKEAEELIKVARTEASREDAQDAINRANVMLGKATDALAGEYAASLTADARARLAQAVALEKDGKYVESRKVAEEANLFAHDALYRVVDESEAAIATARFYRGWDFKGDKLATLIMQARKAREGINTGRYDESNILARAVVEQAKKLSGYSREADFRQRAKAVTNLLNDRALKSGSAYIQSSELRGLIEELGWLERNYDNDKYDELSQRLAIVQNKVETLINSSPKAMDTMLQTQYHQLDELEKLGAKQLAPYELDLARRTFNQADQDYRAGRYTLSYDMMVRGVRLSNSINGLLREKAYVDSINEILKDLQSAMDDFRQYLNTDPYSLVQLVTGPYAGQRVLALAGGDDPSKFADRTKAIYSRALRVQAPESLRHIQNQMIETCREAMLAGEGFQKFLILDQYNDSTRKEIIMSAFDHIKNVREKQGYLRERIVEPGVVKEAYQPAIQKMLQ